MPTILLKKSDTPGSVPGTANLTNLAGGVEVAVNTADKRVYSMTSASAVIELGTNPSSLTCADVSATVFRSASATITNLIATSASITTLTNNPTFSAGTANGVLYLNGSKVATSGSALYFNGTQFGVGANAINAANTAEVTGDINTTWVASANRFVGMRFIDGSGYEIGMRAIESTRELRLLTKAADGTGLISFYTGATPTERMRLTTSTLYTDSSINVGIGTSSPATKLDTAGTVRSTTQTVPSSGTGAELYYDATNAGLRGYNRTGAAYVNLALNDNMYVGGGSSGNVGIGTSSPDIFGRFYTRSVGISSSGTTGLQINGTTYGTIDLGAGGTRTTSITGSSTEAQVATVTSIPLLFLTNGAERARITSGGIFQINTTASIASNYKFITKTGTDMNLAISEQANQLAIEAANDSLSANVPLRIYASPLYVLSGETIVGGTTDNGAYNLQCNGTGVWGAGAYVNGSDARLKDDIQSLDSCLDVVNALRPVTFRYKPEHSKDQSVQTGFIAQELQQTLASKPYLEGLVQEGPEHLNVAYQNIIPLLTKAIQEQQAMINDLKAKVAALESK